MPPVPGWFLFFKKHGVLVFGMPSVTLEGLEMDTKTSIGLDIGVLPIINKGLYFTPIIT